MLNYGKSLKYHRLSNNKTLLDIEKATGIGNGNLSRWESGKNLPNIDFCVILADFYGISLDELIGRDDFGTIKLTENTISDIFSEEDKLLIESFHKLNPYQQEAILIQITTLNKQNYLQKEKQK